MSLNLTEFFEALGRMGRNGFVVNTAQNDQATVYDQLIALDGINPSWLASLSASYDALIRQESLGIATWATAAQTLLMAVVSADNPAYGNTIGSSLLYLFNEMVAQGVTVQECQVSGVSAAESGNVGSPAVLISVTRRDGLIFQNIIPEVGTLFFTDDAYTGEATIHQEPWEYVGAPNISALGTGTAVGTYDWDWPQGSGVSVTGNLIDASQEATEGGNLLTNGDFETWTGSAPAVLDSWNLAVGTWGTTIQRSTSAAISGTYGVEFVAGATLNELRQQFNSAETDGTDETAGTDIAITAFRTYGFNVYLKAAGVITTGTLVIDFVDDNESVITDQQGTAQQQQIVLTGHATTWTAHPFEFRLPTRLPSIVRIRIYIRVALGGANLYMDWAALAQMVSLYTGGPNILLFANPDDDAVEAGPDPDGFQFTFANDYGGSQFGASFQTLVSRLYQTPDLILPYDPVPTIPDNLITDA